MNSTAATNAQRALSAAACDTLVVADPFTVAWLTGWAPDILSGPSPFAAAPIVVVAPDGALTAICSTDEEPALQARGIATAAYEGFTLGPLAPHAGALQRLGELPLTGRVGVEAHALPLAAAPLLGERPRDVAEPLRAARAVKTDAEIAALRETLALCDAGQAAARAAAQPGASELDVWAATTAAIERAAGGRVPLLADLLGGARTAEIGGLPGDLVLRDGDLLLSDIVPRRTAYWGDSCATVVVGGADRAPAAVRDAHARVTEALERGLDALRPGAVAGEVDARCRAGLGYPHHSGHGIGTAAHEQPRIVPGAETVLEPGMVVALEPGFYAEQWGLRCERVALVTDGAPEILSTHDVGL